MAPKLQWDANMNVELRPTGQIKPYERKPRNNDKAVAAVAESLQQYGFRQPIVVDNDGVIVCGHTRWKASQKLGLTEVPVHVATDLTPEQIKAYRIADNKTSDLSSWDLELLPIELADLQALDVDLSLLGFSVEELGKLLNGGVADGQCDPDDIPAPPDEAMTQRGDIWLLGDHRLMCGDSALAEDVDKLLAGQLVHLINTDPPYNVKVEPRSNNAIAAGNSSFSIMKSQHLTQAADAARGDKGLHHHQSFDVARQGKKQATHKKLRAKDRPLANDFVSDAQFDRLLAAWFGNISRVLVPGRSFFIWGGYANLGNYPPALKNAGLYFSQGIVWDKEHPVLSRKDFLGAFELAFYGWKEGAGHFFFGPNNVTDLWHVKKINPMQMEHLTAKPAELAVRAMQYSSRVGENVLDPFGGSGWTLIAAEQTQRRCFIMELDTLYCDVICDRYQRFIGKPAVNTRTGMSPIPMKPREMAMR